VTTLDWVIVGFAAVTAAVGFRRGLIGTVFSLVGFAAGAVFGARIAPRLLPAGSESHYTALVGFAGALAGALLFQFALSIVARFLRSGLHLAPPLHLVDSLGGLAAGAAWGLALVWVAGAVVAQSPGHPDWRQQAKDSQVLQRLNDLVSPRDVLRLRAGVADRLSSGR